MSQFIRNKRLMHVHAHHNSDHQDLILQLQLLTNSTLHCNFDQSPTFPQFWPITAVFLSAFFHLTSVLWSELQQTCESNIFHLPTEIATKDCEKQYPSILCESRGNLFCTACNAVVEHKRKLSIDKHFATAKHKMRTAETQAGRQTKHRLLHPGQLQALKESR